jgi:hypothetical protein
MGSSLTIVAIIGLALVPQASYAEEANNTCVAGSPCGEAILAAFVAEDCKAAITKTRGFKDWTELEECQLLNLLDDLNSQGVKFALSNVLYHKGFSNELLIEWSQKYIVYYLDKSYSNYSYHFKERDAKTVEVVITNFKSEDYAHLII